MQQLARVGELPKDGASLLPLSWPIKTDDGNDKNKDCLQRNRPILFILDREVLLSAQSMTRHQRGNPMNYITAHHIYV